MRSLIGCALCAIPLAVAPPAYALRIAMPNYQTGQKAAMAEAVVVGKVTSIEPDRVELETHPGSKEKASFQIAVVKIESAMLGAKNLTHLKVAFAPMPLEGGANPGVRPFRPGMGGPVPLSEGQEGLFFLVPHTPGSNILKIPMGLDPVPAGAANYKDELAKVKAFNDVLADPLKAMKAEKLADRQAAAGMLAMKYATPPLDGAPAEQVPLDAELSKAIVATILEIDWAAPNAPGDSFGSGPMLASRFGLAQGSPLGIPKFVVKPGENYNTRWKQAIQEWAKANPEKVVLKKYVPKGK
jgi:hypothetical protein